MFPINDRPDTELYQLAQDLIAIAEEVKETFRSLYMEAVASGDLAQVKEVQDYMNEEAQTLLQERGNIAGFEVDFEFDFDGKVDFDAGVNADFFFFDAEPPSGKPQA